MDAEVRQPITGDGRLMLTNSNLGRPPSSASIIALELAVVAELERRIEAALVREIGDRLTQEFSADAPNTYRNALGHVRVICEQWRRGDTDGR